MPARGAEAALERMKEFGCHDHVRQVVRELPESTSVLARGKARAYLLLLPSDGSPSAMHAHRDRLYLLLDPDDATVLNDAHGSTLMKLNDTTWYVSWSATQLGDESIRPLVVAAAERALERARARVLTPGEGPGSRRTRVLETCSDCWTEIRANSSCNCE
ncbi:MAG: hypothetical protein M3P04_08295 [Actinomycetota bacterium]|nr:hypothetical protein [Actinomycetota bacterium]